MREIKVLFLAANPGGTSHLRLDEEIRAITDKIRSSEYRDCLDLVSVWAVRPDDLLQALNEHKPQIVHFSGHGNPLGEIILTDNYGASKPVATKALKALFKVLKDNIQVVLLNACYSRPQAEAIINVVDCAIGMNISIGDRAAIIFAASFYRAIGFGRSVQDAFEQGKVALLLEGVPEENTPDLLSRAGVDPSQISLLQSTVAREGNRGKGQSTEFQKSKVSDSQVSDDLSVRGDKPIFDISGRLDAGIVNLGGTQTFQAPIILNVHPHLQSAVQSINKMPSAAQAAKDALIGLVDQLKEQLEKVPLEKVGDSEKIARRVEVLVNEVNQKKLDKGRIKIAVEDLIKATESLATVMPTMMGITTQISEQVLKIVE